MFFLLRLRFFSNTHWHDDVAVLVIFAGIFRPHLSCGLRVFEFQPDFAFIPDSFEEVDHVGGVEADHDGVEIVRRLDGVFRFPCVRG